MTNDQRMCIRANPSGDRPVVDPTAYVDPTARIIGRVTIGANVFVGPNAVIRADEVDSEGNVLPIIIESECNVQDGVIIHSLSGTQITIGRRTSVSHGAIVHGPCKLAEGCFVGFGAVVFRANIGSGVLISARAVVEGADVPADVFIPPGAVIYGEVGSGLESPNAAQREFMEKVVNANLKLARGYLECGPVTC